MRIFDMQYPDDFINKVIHGDCLDVMKQMPDKCVDLVLTDPPYGTTTNDWDITVDFWTEFKRICRSGFVIFSSQPFTTDLINSNRKDFKYCWIWNKGMTGNFALAKYQPLKIHEEICVFGNVSYYPIMRKGALRTKGGGKGNENIGGLSSDGKLSDDYYPVSILDFNNARNRSNSVHPTQKPVDLLSYLITSFSKDGQIILDPFGGSCTTAVACKQMGRKYICIEKEEKYIKICHERLAQDVLF